MNIEILTGAQAREVDPENVQWPDDSLVAFAYEGNEIIGRQGMIELPHLEGALVKNSKETPRLAAQLVATMEESVRILGRSHLFAFALESQPEVSDYLQRFGYQRFPVEVFCKTLIERAS